MKDNDKKTTPSRFHAEAMLLAATFFWGWTFPVVRDAVAQMPVFAFLALRFALAAALMLLITRRLPSAADWRLGGVLGAMLFLVFALQTWGLTLTSAANSGFITGLNVVWVFLLSPGSWRRAWLQIILAVAGLWILTSPEATTFNVGDFLTLLCSVFIAAHIFILAKMDKNRSSGNLALIQFVLVAFISAAISFTTEPALLPPQWDGDIIFALLLTAGGATVFSFWAQTHFQRHTTPIRAGLIFVCEPLFAAIFAVGFYGEIIPPAALPGAILMLAAMILTIVREETNK